MFQRSRFRVSTLRFKLYFISFTLSPNLICFSYPLNEIGRALITDETLFAPAKELYTISSDASFDERKRMACIGIVIRKGCLPVLCLSSRIKCSSSLIGEVLGISLGLQKATQIGISHFHIRMDCKHALDFLKKGRKLNESNATAKQLVKKAREIMHSKKYEIYEEVVLRDENRAADHMADIAMSMEENENERIWTTKVPPGLKQILIEDRAITKVHFQRDKKFSTFNTESRKFQLVPTEEDSIPKPEGQRRAKVVSTWFAGLVYCPMLNLLFI
jgi:ribonuclease HI